MTELNPVRAARRRLGLTQVQAAKRLGVSQPYLSLVENGKRRVPVKLARRLARKDPALATAVRLETRTFEADDFARLLGALKYPGFEYAATGSGVVNPATLVLAAARQDSLPARVTQALPWLLVRFAHVGLDLDWLVDQAKRNDAQNRLGYLVSVARVMAESQGQSAAAARLQDAERTLARARLLKEDTLGRQLTRAERKYLRAHRPEQAAYWNVLTNLRPADLKYAG